ncbi:DUF4142 domain-containing protein [Corallococcus exiguus]|uniref:DUF4142 domain-containing protein n=1 Tax=Corallococcus TaxID=83461 RepID=UPI000ED9642C|nr:MULTISPECIES: DUF4142 domain-containing protein [Corallococcus]NNC07335.1 DUF4142 domain-containing protein [Corallococcus exiguus]NPC51555.1 DUF4142 domain-containing protein [Corallococcus exiguus]RKH75413.1 DUF4142 domain-containing protein [Corallococcus sp. AB032C]
MKRTLHGVTLAAVLFTGGVSLAQSATSANPPVGEKTPPVAKGTVEFKGFIVPADPKAFLERLHYINQSEIKQAKLAQQNSQNPDVQTYAKAMVDAHTTADQKVMDYAKSQNMKLAEMPKATNDMEKKAMAADKADMEKLQALKGAPFDSTYMAGQVGAHDAAIGKVMAAQQGMGATGELATLLTNLTQELPRHRDMAYQTLGKLDDAMGVGGAGTQGGTMEHGSMDHGSTGGATKTK